MNIRLSASWWKHQEVGLRILAVPLHSPLCFQGLMLTSAHQEPQMSCKTVLNVFHSDDLSDHYNGLCMLFRWHYNGVWRGERLGLSGVDRRLVTSYSNRSRPLVFEITKLVIGGIFFIILSSSCEVHLSNSSQIPTAYSILAIFWFLSVNCSKTTGAESFKISFFLRVFRPFSYCLHW